jgi:hypothetical protein
VSTVTYQQVLDATKSVELHHFAGTPMVACCLITVDGRFVLAFGQNGEGEDFDLTRNAIRARDAANLDLSKLLETNPVQKPDPQIEPASSAPGPVSS